jgi:predicted ester cyclase
MENIIQCQRAIVDTHIQAENSKDWSAVYDTFVQNEEAYYDVAPFAKRFHGISGIKDFYQSFVEAIPDFQVFVTGEYDTPGCLIREVTIVGTHQGEYCGIPASKNPVCVEMSVFYLFGTDEDADKLIAERIYFDNELVLRQMRGDADVPTSIGLAKHHKLKQMQF